MQDGKSKVKSKDVASSQFASTEWRFFTFTCHLDFWSLNFGVPANERFFSR